MEFTVKNLAYFYFQVVIYILFISKIYINLCLYTHIFFPESWMLNTYQHIIDYTCFTTARKAEKNTRAYPYKSLWNKLKICWPLRSFFFLLLLLLKAICCLQGTFVFIVFMIIIHLLSRQYHILRRQSDKRKNLTHKLLPEQLKSFHFSFFLWTLELIFAFG